MDVEGIIFDLDGTLVNSIEDISDAANKMLTDHGFRVHEVQDYIRWIGNGAAKLIEAALPNDTDQKLLPEYVNEFKLNYSMNLHNKTRIYDGITELLDHLVKEEIRMAILSNKPHHLTVEVAEFYLSDWTFDPLLGQREGIPRKPDPAAANEIVKMFGLNRDKVILLGDSKNDMVTATAAGVVPVGVNWGYSHVDDILGGGARYMIQHPLELIELLSR